MRRDDDGRFCLGLRLIGLGHEAAEAVPVWAAARPALAWLHEQTGESVQLYVRDGDARVCVESIESRQASSARSCRSAPACRSRPARAGKVLAGATDAGVGRRAWASARRASPACPRRCTTARGRVVAAVSVSGPIQRTTRKPGDRYGDEVADAARQVEAAIAR